MSIQDLTEGGALNGGASLRVVLELWFPCNIHVNTLSTKLTL